MAHDRVLRELPCSMGCILGPRCRAHNLTCPTGWATLTPALLSYLTEYPTHRMVLSSVLLLLSQRSRGNHVQVLPRSEFQTVANSGHPPWHIHLVHHKLLSRPTSQAALWDHKCLGDQWARLMVNQVYQVGPWPVHRRCTRIPFHCPLPPQANQVPPPLMA